jgi:hypothetical protein
VVAWCHYVRDVGWVSAILLRQSAGDLQEGTAIALVVLHLGKPLRISGKREIGIEPCSSCLSGYELERDFGVSPGIYLVSRIRGIEFMLSI